MIFHVNQGGREGRGGGGSRDVCKEYIEHGNATIIDERSEI